MGRLPRRRIQFYAPRGEERRVVGGPNILRCVNPNRLSNMTLEGDLPAIHLQGELLVSLEEALLSGCTDPDVDVRLTHGTVTYRYQSMEAIRNDVILPPVIRSFEVTVTAAEGRIEITSNRQARLRLTVAGDDEWTNERYRELTAFFRRYGATVRTALERYLAIGMALGAIALSLAVYFSGFGWILWIRRPVDSLLLGSLALIVGGLANILLAAVYPYAAIIPDRRTLGPIVHLHS